MDDRNDPWMEAEMAFLEMTDLLADMEENDRKALELIEAIAAGNLPADIHDDAPLTLEMAMFLPELQGVFTVSPDFRSRSESMTVKTLRGAIDRGDLTCLRPNKNLFVTRRMIREWLERCQREKENRTSSSGGRDTRTGGSPTARRGSSRTATSLQLALDAARASMKKPR